MGGGTCPACGGWIAVAHGKLVHDGNGSAYCDPDASLDDSLIPDFADAAVTARQIADRLRGQADNKTGDERRLKIAMSIGARMVAVKLSGF